MPPDSPEAPILRHIRALLCAALLSVVSTNAFAGGINLSWDDCGAFGTAMKSFACDTNAGADVAVISFTPHWDIDMIALEARIDLQSRGPAIPSWWDVWNAGSCRSNGLVADAIFGGTHCLDPGFSFALIGEYTRDGNRPDFAKILIAAVMPDGASSPVDISHEYYGVRLVIHRSHTVGAGVCAGCLEPVGLALNRVSLAYGPEGSLVQSIETPIDRNFICWQCACGPQADGPGGFSFSYCPVTPTLNRTWGQIKSLYR